MSKGTLVLVVGPSGAGKDSVIDGAKRRLAGDSGFVFPRRFVTRAAEAGGEDHCAVSETDFHDMEMDGAFALSWRAHGLSYGLPRAIERDLEAGRMVIANVSRAVVDAARSRYPVRIAIVTAPISVLAARLAARDRETAADIEERLRRAADDMPDGPDVTVIDNSGPLDRAVDAFVSLLKDAGAARRR